MLAGDPRTPVCDLDEGPSVPSHPDRHLVATVLDCVADQVGDDALEPARVAGQLDLLRLEPHALLPAARADGGRGQCAELDALGVDALLAGVEARDLHQ